MTCAISFPPGGQQLIISGSGFGASAPTLKSNIGGVVISSVLAHTDTIIILITPPLADGTHTLHLRTLENGLAVLGYISAFDIYIRFVMHVQWLI